MNGTKLVVGLMGLLASAVVGCAAGPIGEREDGTAKTESEQAEEHVGQTQSELKWTRPKCADDTWVCGRWLTCICNACGVEDCRNALTTDTVAP